MEKEIRRIYLFNLSGIAVLYYPTLLLFLLDTRAIKLKVGILK